jgi:hypothetical protein
MLVPLPSGNQTKQCKIPHLSIILPLKSPFIVFFPYLCCYENFPSTETSIFTCFSSRLCFFPQRVLGSVTSDPHPPLWRNRSTCSVPLRLETCLCSPPEKKDLRVAQAFKLSPQSHSWEVTRYRHQNTGEQIDYTNTQQKVDPTHKSK